MTEHKTIEKYFNSTNEILGILSIGLGLGCISTNDTRLYAWICFVMVCFAWFSSISNYRSSIIYLRLQGHPALSWLGVIKRGYVGILGYLFLFLIAMGYLDKNGINL